MLIFFLIKRRPPSSTGADTLFPDASRFRSHSSAGPGAVEESTWGYRALRDIGGSAAVASESGASRTRRRIPRPAIGRDPRAERVRRPHRATARIESQTPFRDAAAGFSDPKFRQIGRAHV